MRPRQTRVVPWIVATLLFAGQLAQPAAAVDPSRERIYFARITNPQGTFAIAPDGSGRQSDPCPGDRTHGGAPRGVLRIEATGGTFPAHGESDITYDQPISQLFARDESCASPIQLTNLPAGYRLVSARWSLDGRRVAFGALRYGATSELMEQGLYAGDVDASCTVSVCLLQNVHLAVSLPLEPVANQDTSDGLTAYYEYWVTASWSSDGRRVAFQRGAAPSTSGLPGIYVADLGPIGSTATVVATRLTIANAAAQPFDPAFSTVAGDDRIAFVQLSSTKSCYRNDIFVVAAAGGTAIQVTTPKTANVCQLARPEWSPDGLSFAFDAVPLSLAGQGIYRIAADGSSKAVLLAFDKGVFYAVPKWRR